MRRLDAHQSPSLHPRYILRSAWNSLWKLHWPDRPLFAVGAFDDWSRVRAAFVTLGRAASCSTALNCLALERVFDSSNECCPQARRSRLRQSAAGYGWDRDDRLLHLWTSGRLPDGQTRSGATSLKDALGRWLILRHARQLEEAVCSGRILLWIRLTDADDERRAYQSLLAHSSDVVGVADLGA